MLSTFKTIAKQNNYVLYTRPYELNIWGIRSKSQTPNRFDDFIHVFFKRNALQWEHHVFSATTDPGTYWLNNPMMPQGTAILKSGQYKGAYQLGLHRGEYLALVQTKKVSVVRDYNRNNRLDFYARSVSTGLFGINIHRAMRTGLTHYVDKFSAGCQVFSNAGGFHRFIELCKRHRDLYGNRFSYTLVDYRHKAKAKLRKLAVAGLLTASAATGIYFFTKHNKNKYRADGKNEQNKKHQLK